MSPVSQLLVILGSVSLPHAAAYQPASSIRAFYTPDTATYHSRAATYPHVRTSSAAPSLQMSAQQHKRRMLFKLVPAVVVGCWGYTEGASAAAVLRGSANEGVIFKEDFYYKFGKMFPPIDADTPLPSEPPFTRVQQRYDAYTKYSSRVVDGRDAFAAIRALISEGKWGTVDASDPRLGLRPMGLLANGLLANDSINNLVLLSRFFVNEVFLAVSAVSAAKDQQEAEVAWEKGRLFLNSYLVLVNKVIIPERVGEKFQVIPTST